MEEKTKYDVGVILSILGVISLVVMFSDMKNFGIIPLIMALIVTAAGIYLYIKYDPKKNNPPKTK